MKISVIGAGLGGLSAAAILASQGHHIDLFEQNDEVGGKLKEVRSHGFRFDTVADLLSMPFLLEQIFEKCGKKASNYLEWYKLEPVCRYQFTDGSVFVNYQDPDKNRQELMRIAPEDVEVWDSFLDYSAGLYHRASETYLFNPLESLRDLNTKNIPDLIKIDAFSTVAKRVDTYFSSPRMRQLFKQFPAFNGSSPYQAPATLNVIPYMELCLGGYYIKGGLYNLIRSFHTLAEETGVRVHTGIPVDLIVPDPGKKQEISGIMINGSLHEYDAVITNSDATTTYTKLMPGNALSGFKRRKLLRTEPSCSVFVVLLGINRTYDQLENCNIFFSEDCQNEFRAIFERGELPVEPTIYVTNSSLTEPSDAPPGCSNLCLLVNAPYTDNGQHWHEWKDTYTDHLIHTLESRGLDQLRESVIFRKTITPADFERNYGSNRGSMYGASFNKRNSFLSRPRNKSPWFNNLYLCGRSTHPGGGIPQILQSAMNVSTLMNRRNNQ